MGYVILKFRDEIIDKTGEALDVSKDLIDENIEIPSEERGDYALPCYSLSGVLEKDPKEIAQEVAENVELEKGTLERIGPYVNFKTDRARLSKETILTCLEMEEDFGTLPSKSKKLIVEHTSANPNGPLHVGRARNPIIGDTLARIYEKAGYEVETQYYVNDIGRQIAILVWGTLNIDEEDLPEVEREKPDHELVRYYQRANQLLEEDDDIEEEIQQIIRRMERGEEDIFKHFQKTAKKIMEGIDRSLQRLGIHLGSYKTESSLIEDSSVKKVIKQLSDLEDTGKEDGALYYEKEDNRTFLARKNGTSLYPARDIAYHVWKAERADLLVNILGEDHKLHGEFIQNALKDLNIQPVPQILFHSFVTFEGQEMSTRKGTYVTLDHIMDTAHEKAKEEVKKRREVPSDEIKTVAEKIAMGAVRYNIIKVQPQKPIDFVWEEALDFEGDSAPFLQYSYTRANSILEKWSRGSLDINALDLQQFEKGETKLLKKISEFPREIEDAVKNNAPHRLAKYAHGLAGEFNQFYRDYPVLQAEDKKLERIAIVKSFRSAMGSVLQTLGIKKPKKM
ncbi:MAG: arginine--tRNA ligase [Candidatus Aenigmatarchaeota archaeon]